MKGPAVTSCIYLLCLLGFTEPKITYTGNQLWKITNDNKTAMQLLTNLQKENLLTIWAANSTKIDAMVNAQAIKKFRKTLLEHDLKYQVSIEDIQKAIDEENPKPLAVDGRKGYRLTWEYYHELRDIYEYLHYLEGTFPKLCQVRTIGYSTEGRPIKLLRISNRRRGNRAIFIEGGIHAREWISPSAVTYIIDQFVSNFEKEPESVKNTDWYIVPVLNPDGYEYSYYTDRLWRKNRSKTRNSTCIGVDLNRNFGYNWGVKNGASSDPCSTSYRGRRPFSEPETAAVANLFLRNPNVDWVAYISIHSYGQYIVYPYGSPKMVLEDQNEMDRLGLEAAKKIKSSRGEIYTVGPVGVTIYPASGISIDWAKNMGVKYAYTMEMSDMGRHGFILPARFIKKASEDGLILVKTIARVGRHL